MNTAAVAFPRTSEWKRAARWLAGMRSRWLHPRERQLKLRETLPLGEKRFLAVVEFERQRFLIGGAANSVSLLTELPSDAQGREP
jgi:flagellar biogenesis protein FliO